MADKERRTCSIDLDPKKLDWVAGRHIEGRSFSDMERLSKATTDVPAMKRETIARHIKECMGITAGPVEVREAAEQAKLDKPKTADVATLVQEQVVEKLQAGEARVTVQHGLQAQQLIDRRAERAKDRELAVTLARLLHTGEPPSSAIRHREVAEERSEDIIEGEVVRVG